MVRNTIIQVAKNTKDEHAITQLARLARRYKLYNKKEDLARIESLLRTTFPNTRLSHSDRITSEEKDKFIDVLAKLTASNTPTTSREQTLNQFFKTPW